jgi:hypothetical protein
VIRRWWSNLSRTVKGLVALAAGLTVVITLATTAWDAWDQFKGTPPAVTGSVAVQPSWLHNVELARFAHDHPPWQTDVADGATAGAVFTVTVKLDGLEDKTALLRWQPVNAKTFQAIDAQSWERRTLELQPSRTPWQDEVEVWLPYPRVAKMLVRFSVEHEGETLGSTQSRQLKLSGD